MVRSKDYQQQEQEQGPDIDDMLRSQEASRRSKLLESRIQASLQTIANWRLEEELIGEMHDTPGTGRTSPSTSCGSNETLHVVKYNVHGQQKKLRNNLFPQSIQETSNHSGLHRQHSVNTRPLLVADSHKKTLSKVKTPLNVSHGKSLNVVSTFTDDKKLKTAGKPPLLLVATDTPPRAFSPLSPVHTSRSSKKTRGEHIRIMKQYDAELLESMRMGTPRPVLKSNKRGSSANGKHKTLTDTINEKKSEICMRREAAVVTDTETVQDYFNTLDEDTENDPPLKLPLTKANNIRPPLERRVSQLMTMADDIKGETILFPRAPQRRNSSMKQQKRSNSGRREKLISSTKQQQSSRWFHHSLESFRRRKPTLSGKSWRPSSFKSLGKKKETRRSKSCRNVRGTKKTSSWDNVPDSSEFPPSFFGTPVLVKQTT